MTYDLQMAQGADFSATFRPKDSSGNPLDLTGFEVRSQARRTVSAQEVLLDISSYASISGGDIALHIPAEATSTLQSGVYDLFLVKDEVATRLLEGRLIVSPSVTR